MLTKGYPKVEFIKQIRRIILNLGDYLLIPEAEKNKGNNKKYFAPIRRYGVRKVWGTHSSENCNLGSMGTYSKGSPHSSEN